MTLDELLEQLLARLRNPQQLLVYAWFGWWLWSLIRGKLRRTSEPEQTQQQPPSPDPSPKPTPSPTPSPTRTPVPTPTRAPTSTRAPTPTRVPTPTRGPARTAPPPKTAERDDSVWTRALERAQALHARGDDDRTLRRLQPMIADEVIDPLQSALRDARRSTIDPAGKARAARALATLGVLERVVRERTRERDAAARLAEVDAIADACHAPLRDYSQAEGLQLRGLYPVAVRAPLPDATSAPEYGDALLLLPVPASIGSHLNDYTAALHELGRRWYFGLPGLAGELEAELGVPARMRLLDAREHYDAASIHGYFGPWLPSLFADTALTLRLGTGYVSGLSKSMAAERDVTRARAEAGFVTSRPPALLRLRAALNALASLGLREEAERHGAAFAAEHDGLERSYLPLEGGRGLVVDSSYLLDFTDRVSSAVLDSAYAALGDVPLSGVPGLAQPLEERRQQPLLAQAFTGKRLPERANPVQLLCGALLAWERGEDPQLVLGQLHEALSPRPRRAVAPPRAPRPALGPRSLRAALHDPRTVRAAIVLGAAFERPRSDRQRVP